MSGQEIVDRNLGLPFREDPTTYYLEGDYDSFEPHKDFGAVFLESIIWYAPEDRVVPNIQFVTSPVTSDSNWEPVYANKTFITHLNDLKDSYSVSGADIDTTRAVGVSRMAEWRKLFLRARTATNPYEKLGSAGFINRAAVKLANIDWVFKLHSTRNPRTNQGPEELVFADLCGAPGGFVEYLQKVYPRSRGYGMSLRPPPGDTVVPEWDPALRYLQGDRELFTPFYGNDDSGNIYTSWADFVRMIRGTQTPFMDIVTADGGFDVGETEDGGSNYNRQEYLSSRLILLECITALIILKPGGTFVVKVFDTFSRFMGDLLYLVSLCFNRTCIFKPCSSRPANGERYAYFEGGLGIENAVVTGVLAVLNQAAQQYQSDPNDPLNTIVLLDSILAAQPPQTFIDWLSNQNKRSVFRQLRVGESLLNYMRHLDGKDVAYLRKFEPADLQKACILWGIGDNVHDNDPLAAEAKGKKKV